jgi:hypothetical protein
MRSLLVIVVMMCVSPAIAGGAHCAKFQTQSGAIKHPAQPACMDTPFAVHDQMSFDNCRADVQVYLNEVDDYLKCLNEDGNDVVRERNALVDRFNCKMSGAICS